MTIPPTPSTPEPSCAACAFWSKSTKDLGLCRRWGPDHIVVGLDIVSGWPETTSDDWCGEFEAADIEDAPPKP